MIFDVLNETNTSGKEASLLSITCVLKRFYSHLLNLNEAYFMRLSRPDHNDIERSSRSSKEFLDMIIYAHGRLH